LAAVAWLGAGWASGAASLDVWGTGDMAAVSPAGPREIDASVFDATGNRVNLFAAANETVSFQLVVDAPADGARGVRFSCTDLSGRDGRKIASANIRAFRALPVATPPAPPWYPLLIGPSPTGQTCDILVPLDAAGAGQPYKLSPRQRLVLWVDLSVPRQTVGDNYAGTVSLSAEGLPPWRAEVALKVYNFVLPDHRPLPAVAGFDHRQVYAAMVRRDGQPFVPVWMDRSQGQVLEGLKLIRQMMQLARRHGVDLFISQLQPLIKRDIDGNIRLDWRDYDAIVSPYLDGSAFDDGLPSPAWPMPLDETWPNSGNYGGADGPDYLQTIKGIEADCMRHYAQSPWAGDKMFFWPCRQNVATPAGLRLARSVKHIRPGLQNVPLLWSLPLEPASTAAASQAPLDLKRDMFAPPGEYFVPPSEAAPGSPLAGTWLTGGMGVAAPPLGGLATAADVRAACWFAFKSRCRGLFIADCLNWQNLSQPSEQVRLFYPGSVAGCSEILPSVRLKQLRRGLQDLAYLDLLRQRQREKVADAVIDSLARRAGVDASIPAGGDTQTGQWEAQSIAWRLGRALMAEEISAAINPAESDGDLLAQQIAWEHYWNRTQSVRVERSRCALTRSQAAGSPGEWEARLSLDLHNELSGKLEVQLAWQNLPDRWQESGGASERTVLLPACSSQRLELSARGPTLPLMQAGKVPMPLSMTIEAQPPRAVMAEMPVIRAAAVAGPPRIDGVLDDWPARPGNCATDFVTLQRRDGQGGRLAQKQTLVFALADRENLYLAFRCHESEPAGIVAKPSNVVAYDQYLPFGEDLVEVLLDPGNSASAPHQLYHIVVKPNGAVLAQRGVGARPSLGAVGAWSGPSSVAVGKTAEGWTVEMAIPLAAFGPEGQSPLWGVNFVRYSPAGMEASSWSQVSRHFYDPSSLGAMILGPAAQEVESTSSSRE
jgi:hypothetical protein